MSGLLGAKSQAPSVERLGGLQVSSSGYGDCIPVIYGSVRVSTHLTDYDDFHSVENTSDSGGGKGGPPKQVTGYSYYCSIFALLGEPEIRGIGRVWLDKDVKDSAGLNLFYGSPSQSPWPIWQTKHPAKALPYGGLAYVTALDFALSSSGGMPNINIEVFGKFSDLHDSGDSPPEYVLNDILTNQTYGLGLSSGDVADFFTIGDYYYSGWAAYCAARGFRLSRAFTDQAPAAESIEEIMTATDSIIRLKSGERKMYIDVLPLGVNYVGSYEPYRTPITDILDTDAIGVISADGDVSDDLGVEFELVPDSDVYNNISVTFTDRSKEYNDATASASDDWDAADFGEKVGSSADLKVIPSYEHASAIASALVDKSVFDRKKVTIRISMALASFLEPGDIVTFTSALFNYSRSPFVIYEISAPESLGYFEGAEDGKGVRLTLRPYRGTVTATMYPRGEAAPGETGAGGIDHVGGAASGSGSAPVGPSSPPGPSAEPVVFEPPGALTGGQRQLWLATAGGSMWGGAQVHVSVDNGASYAMAGTAARARYGTTTAPLSSSGASVGVQLVGYQASSLDGTSAAAAASGATLTWIGGEVVSYQDTTPLGGGAYTVAGLTRGLKGTSPAAHLAGADFVRLDTRIFKYDIPDGFENGGSVKLKLPAFNVFGSGIQGLDECEEYTIAIQPEYSPQVGAVSVQSFSTRPAANSGESVFAEDEWSDGVLWSGGSPKYVLPVWCRVTWSWSDANPAGGFEVLLFSNVAGNPDDKSSWIRIITTEPACRSALIAVRPASEVYIFAAVRPVNG